MKTNENDIPKSIECSKNSIKWKVYSDIGLPQEIRKISNNQQNFTPKGTRSPKSVEKK